MSDDRAARIAELRALMSVWSTERMVEISGSPAARSLLADAGLELLAEIDRLTAERDAIAQANRSNLEARQCWHRRFLEVRAERDAALGREAALREALDNTTRELQLWHDTRPDPPGPLRDYCVSCGYLADARALLADNSGPGQEGG